MSEFDQVLIIAAAVFFAGGLRHLARWWDKRRAATAAGEFHGHAIDVSPIRPRIAAVRASYMTRTGSGKKSNLRRRARLLELARRTIQHLAYIRSARAKAQTGH